MDDIGMRFMEAYSHLLAKGLVTGHKDFASKIAVSTSMITEISKGRSNVGMKAIQNIVNRFAIDADWLLTGRGSMLRQEQPMALINYEPSVGVPYYNVDFIGGFDLIGNDQTITPEHNIVFKPYDNASLWCNITGNSMAQKINHGDVIALQQINSIEDILYGEIYAVVLDTLRTVKILRKSSNPNKLRFIPINTDEYDEQEFDKNRIIKIYAVLGSISRFF